MFKRIVVGLLAVCLTLIGQTITASLEGTASDPTGALIPGAKIQIRNTATGVVTNLQSGTDGRFVAVSLPAGNYSVTAEAAGFKRTERTGIVLEVNQKAVVDITLEVGAVNETVEITSQAPLLDAASSAVGQVVDNKSIVNLPMNQRNPYSLVFLTPGVTGSVNAEFNQANISINGGRPGSNEILVDGIPSAPPLVNPIQGYTVYPSVDAVQEFRVQTDSYSAEFGRSGGGIINLIYKSGTNDLHGSVYEFLRNSKLDSNNFFSNRNGIPLSSFKRSQFGVSAGGPVEIPKLYHGRNKTFFFADYEGLRQRSLTTLSNTVPTALQRAGDFSQTLDAAGKPVTIYDPLTTQHSGSGFIRQAFPGNIIPSNRFDPVGRNVMKYYPLPNGPGAANSGANNFNVAGASIYNANQFDIKVDENINDNNRFFTRYSHRKLDFPAPNLLPGNLAPYDGALNQPQIVNNGAFDYTHNLTPTFLMDFRYGFGRSLLLFTPHSDGFDPTTLGFPSYIDANSERLMFPGIAPSNYLSLGASGSSFRHNAFETHNLSMNNTKVLTRHVLKFGFETRLVRVNNSEAGNSVGAYNFSRGFTQGPDPNRASVDAGDAIASLLLGLGSGGTFTKCFKCVSTQSTYWAGYFGDDWKVSGKLTLNLGLRYELETPRTERYNRLNVFDPNVASPLAGPAGLPNLQGGLVFAGVNGNSRRQFPVDANNFAPRFGFAYQATTNTVLRGGFGIFYAPSLRAAGGSVGNFGWRSDTPYIGTADGVTPLNYLSNPFPSGFAPVLGSSQGLLTGIGSSIAASIIGDSVTPYSENWSFGVQRQLPGNVLLDASYVGSHGVHLNVTGEGDVSLNQLTAAQIALGTQLQQQVANPFYGLISISPLNAKTIPYSFLLRPYPQFTTVYDMYQTGGISNYHSLQVKVEKRFSSGLSLLASYTDAKLIDDYSIISNVGRQAGLQDIYDRHADRGVSANDISQRFVMSYVYALPFGRGMKFGGGWNRAVDAVLGGWQMNGILTLQTGMPLALSAANTSNAGNPSERPNTNGQYAGLSGPVVDRLDRYFDTSAFSQPAPFTFGNVGRTISNIRGPGTRGMDFSLFKNFKLVEKVSLQFRAEAFNLTNTPVFGFPNQAVNSAAFGTITGQANAPRQLQFALKLLF